VGQATQHGQRFGGGRAANEFPDACPHTYKTAGPPPDAALFADSDGGAVPAADCHAGADRDAAADEPACHRTADPDAHLDRDHVGRDHIGRDYVGNAVAAAGERGDFAAPLPGATASRGQAGG
jgi:hypothetical protein